MLHELQWNGATLELDADIMHRSSLHLQSGVSCSMPKLCPISCATVVATTLTIWLWSIDTPPEYSNVQIGPFNALPVKNWMASDELYTSTGNCIDFIWLTYNTTLKLFFCQQLSVVIWMLSHQNFASIFQKILQRLVTITGQFGFVVFIPHNDTNQGNKNVQRYVQLW